MPNKFCRYLSNGYRLKSNGTNLTYSPCCWFRGEVSLINNPHFEIQKAEISKIDHWTVQCASCKQIEDSGVYGDRSPRLRSFHEIPDSVPDNVPTWIELTIDTTCNAACIMCGWWHSTTWRKQEIKFGTKTTHDFPDIVDPMHWLDVIKSKMTFEYVNSVSFLGGEPLESPIPLEFLTLLKKTRGSLGDVTVHFQTNGSLRPSDEIVELLRECKIVRYNISLDAVGERFEYIRYPLLWHRIEDTVEYVKSLRLPNLNFIILSTLTPLNAWYFDEIEQWVSESFKDCNTEKHTVRALPNRCIGTLDLNATPENLRLAIVEKFGVDHPVTKMFSNLELGNTETFVNYCNFLDSNRKTNWRETFSDIVPYFK